MSVDKWSSFRGCGFLLLTCFVTSVFLVFNVAVTQVGYSWLQSQFWLFQEMRVSQAIMYAVPILMVFLEWWIVDFVNDLVGETWGKSNGTGDEQDAHA